MIKKSKSFFIITIISLLTTAGYAKPAKGILNIDVTGSAGSGFTNWTFSGSSTINNAGTIHDSSNNNYVSASALEFSGYIKPGQINDDNIFTTIGGSATITVGTTVSPSIRNITALLIDEDQTLDDLSFRVDIPLTTTLGQTISLSGSQLYNIDLNQLTIGSFLNHGGTNEMVSTGQATINIKDSDSTSIPFELSPTPGLLIVSGIWSISKFKKIKSS